MEQESRVFRDACRQNTGSHFLDSGGAYGRWWQREPIPEGSPVVTWERGYGPTIHTGAFLDATMERDDRVQALFERWAERDANDDLNLFELAERFAYDRLGLVCVARDNTYNGESNLDQCFVWEVYQAPDRAAGDWFYDTDALVVIFVHTGCDVRGGYSAPIFCRSKLYDSAMPMDFVCGFYPIAAHDPEGNPVDDLWAIPEIDRFSIGYSSAPYYELEREAERVFWFTCKEREATCCVLLKSGYRVKFGAEARIDN